MEKGKYFIFGCIHIALPDFWVHPSDRFPERKHKYHIRRNRPAVGTEKQLSAVIERQGISGIIIRSVIPERSYIGPLPVHHGRH